MYNGLKEERNGIIINIEINGINTSYIESGVGEIILLLHGWGCDATVYTSITERLSGRYRVILPELPGFGQTDEPPQPWGVSDYAEFVSAFCKKLNIKPVIIFAHSLGCRIAIKLLSKAVDSSFTEEKTPLAVFTGAAGIKPKRTAKQRFKTRIFKLKKFFLKPFPGLTEKMRQKYGSDDYRNASPIMRQTLVKIVNQDLTRLLSLIKTEVLLIWGENDDSTPISDGRLMESLIENAGLAVIKNAGHYAFLEQPELFGRILDSYLSTEKLAAEKKEK